MATREENLKKINEELELMSDDELDKVAGGGVLLSFGGNPKTDTDSNQIGATKFNNKFI